MLIDLLLDQPKTKSPFFFPADWGEGHFIVLVCVLDRVCQKARLADITPEPRCATPLRASRVISASLS